MCAGPGGKAALLAAEAELSGASLDCNEVAPHRAKLVKQALETFPNNAQVMTGDGREIGQNSREKYDRILLDAPCTGLGALRRRPEARWRKSKSDLVELTKLQRELFESAWLALKPGGVIAYVTCSPHPSETTAQVETFAKNHGDKLALLDANEVLAGLNADLSINRSRKTAQLWPHRNQTDAMFIALMQKVG
jgi:16S rRNA (cytosine967-C5)-methyltransferase